MYRYILASLLIADSAAAQVRPLCVPPDGPMNRSGVVSALFFDSRAHDEKQCAMRVVNGRIVFDPAVTNPAMSCPDRFAWKMFFEAVQGGFWENWATDASMFPGCNGGSVACDGSAPDRQPAAPLPL